MFCCLYSHGTAKLCEGPQSWWQIEGEGIKSYVQTTAKEGSFSAKCVNKKTSDSNRTHEVSGKPH